LSLAAVDLNLLVILRALLEEGNVTHAGERVGMSQPAMSVALGRLRRHYKDEILIRTGRDYELTPLARSLLPVVRETLRLVGEALDPGSGFDPAASDRTFSVALSDYAVTVLSEPLLGRIHERSPGVGIRLRPIPPDMHESDHGLLVHDLLIGPPGYGFPGRHEVLFRDRFVCVVDPANPRLKDGALSPADLSELPHAAAVFGNEHVTPADLVMDRLGIVRRVRVSTVGLLSLPFVVAGTDLVALVPEKLARRVEATAGIAVAEPPFGDLLLVEAAWWHPTRIGDPALCWLRGVLREVASGIAPCRDPAP
jgi:DNA-binding transcriptional LysR family regulator